MRALVYTNSAPRLAATWLLSRFTPRAFVGPLAPIALREVPDPTLPAADWLVVRTGLCGVCGSDAKQVFMNGALDNPMTAMISFPGARSRSRGGVDVIYDTVTSPITLEIGVRITRSRGRIVALGVEPPKRFEWTPLYFKEITLVGSNAFGMETLRGRRMHAMEWYFELILEDGLDVAAIISHRYALRDYRDAFLACHDQGASGAVKVLFDRFA